MTRRPRKLGTFLIGAVGDVAEERGRAEDALDVLALDVLDREQVPHASTRSWEIVTSSTPSSSSTRTLTRSLRAVGRFLPT